MSNENQFCTFTLDHLFFGIEVQKVQEVLRYQDLTRVPLAHPAVSGLINLRGQIVTAIDLRQRLGLKVRPADQLPMNVVIRVEEGAVSFLVDEIGDVVEVEESAYESSPETIDEKMRQLIRGVYKLKDRLLLVLDSERAVQLEAVS